MRLKRPRGELSFPKIVKKEELAAATALNGIEFNVARAVGPALAGVIIAVVGVGAAVRPQRAVVVGVIVLVTRWKRPVRRRTTRRRPWPVRRSPRSDTSASRHR